MFGSSPKKKLQFAAAAALGGGILLCSLWLYPLAVLDSPTSARRLEPTNEEEPTLKSFSEGNVEAAIIPLGSVWAYDMPGPRDIRKLEPHVDLDQSLVAEISDALTPRLGIKDDALNQGNPKVALVGDQPRPGFAVRGTGKEALRRAHAVLVEGEEPEHVFSADQDVSLVFFSKLCDRYVHLREIEYRGRLIKVAYRFVPHETLEMSVHFALIPMPRLYPLDEIRVEMIREPMPKQYQYYGWPPVNKGADASVISRPFTFSVLEPDQQNSVP